jgi:predicted TIM-barrel fold metal-dependent hydrolase
MAAVLISGLVCAFFSVNQASGKSPETIVRVLDADGDGKVNRNEWRKSKQLFDRIDSDGNGSLTVEELRTFMGGEPEPVRRTAATGRQALSWIDVHVHPSPGRGLTPDAAGTIAAAVAAIDADHIGLMVLLPPPMVDVMKFSGKVVRPVPIERWIDEARKYPDRFVVMGGGGSLNAIIHDESPDGRPSDALKARFAQRAEAIMDMGAVGFGELAVSHLSMVPGQPYMVVPADHPLLLLLADIAARHDTVIDVHFDPVLEDMPRPDYVTSENPRIIKRNIDAFERFLDHNPRARISWAHVGSDRLNFWTAAFTREILARHANLYMSLRMFASKSGLNHPLTGTGITDDWMRTFEQFPDRFFIGGDQFFVPPALRNKTGPGATFARMSQNTRDRVNRFLTYLPPDIARKFAYENAMRVYKLPANGRLPGQ